MVDAGARSPQTVGLLLTTSGAIYAFEFPLSSAMAFTLAIGSRGIHGPQWYTAASVLAGIAFLLGGLGLVDATGFFSSSGPFPWVLGRVFDAWILVTAVALLRLPPVSRISAEENREHARIE